jgi:hypothetical protein
MHTRKQVISEISATRRQKGLNAFEKRAKMTRLVVEQLKSQGQFFKKSPRTFYFHRETSQLYPLEERTRKLSAFLEQEFALNEAEHSEYDHILTTLANEAFREGREMKVHRLSHYDSASNTLYVSRFNGSVYKLNGETIEEVGNGTDDVFFWDDPRWKPYEIERIQGTPMFKRIMVDSINFCANLHFGINEQRFLYLCWMLAQFFDSLHPTRPIVSFCGEKGSGKTSALRKWPKLLFGPEGEVTALERSRPDGFIATVSSQPVVVFDNVDDHIGWLPDHLAQVATGIAVARRELYTTNEETRFTPVSWVALTSRTPQFLNRREDVLDRTIIFHTTRLVKNIPEHVLLAEIERWRNRLWSELLHVLNLLVKEYREQAVSPLDVSCRMADFASFVMRCAKLMRMETTANRALHAMQSRQNQMLRDEEPIFECLKEWLVSNSNNAGRFVTSRELETELRLIATKLGLSWPYSGARSLAQRLSHITTNLETDFVVEVQPDSSEQNHYAFWLKAETPDRPESPERAIQDRELTENTMHCGIVSESLNHFSELLRRRGEIEKKRRPF